MLSNRPKSLDDLYIRQTSEQLENPQRNICQGTNSTERLTQKISAEIENVRLFLYNAQMAKKYIISLEQTLHYPFDGPKQPSFQVTVRTRLTPTPTLSLSQLHKNIDTLLSINSHTIITILRLLEIKNTAIVVDYEYVSETLTRSPKLAENGFMNSLKEQLSALCLLLAEKNIKIDLKMEDIGLTPCGLAKLFILPTFQITSQDTNKLSAEYQLQIDRLLDPHLSFRHSLRAPSELSDYSYHLDKKISEIEDKLNRRKRRGSKGSKGRSSPDSQPQTEGLDFPSTTLSTSSLHSRKTFQSLIQGPHKPKMHKLSFNDYTHHQQREEQREDSLKKRLKLALDKTQEAFKIYEKFKRQHRRL